MSYLFEDETRMTMKMTMKTKMKKNSGIPRTVARSKTGELYFLDTMTMRIRACPVEKQLQFQLLGLRLSICAKERRADRKPTWQQM